MAAGLCCTSCNNEWEDEQFLQMPSLKAEPNNAGVTPVMCATISMEPNAIIFR